MKQMNQNAKTAARYRAIGEIIAKYSTTSPTLIVKYLASIYNIKSTRQTVTEDLKKDLEKLTSNEIESIKSQMISEIDTLIEIVYKKSISDDKEALKAGDLYNRLIKTKGEIINKFHEFSLAAKKEERPIYHITIGKQKKIDLKKVKK